MSNSYIFWSKCVECFYGRIDIVFTIQPEKVTSIVWIFIHFKQSPCKSNHKCIISTWSDTSGRWKLLYIHLSNYYKKYSLNQLKFWFCYNKQQKLLPTTKKVATIASLESLKIFFFAKSITLPNKYLVFGWNITIIKINSNIDTL